MLPHSLHRCTKGINRDGKNPLMSLADLLLGADEKPSDSFMANVSGGSAHRVDEKPSDSLMEIVIGGSAPRVDENPSDSFMANFSGGDAHRPKKERPDTSVSSVSLTEELQEPRTVPTSWSLSGSFCCLRTLQQRCAPRSMNLGSE